MRKNLENELQQLLPAEFSRTKTLKKVPDHLRTEVKHITSSAQYKSLDICAHMGVRHRGGERVLFIETPPTKGTKRHHGDTLLYIDRVDPENRKKWVLDKVKLAVKRAETPKVIPKLKDYRSKKES